jgi:endonuclease/exonuclease/phosphatase family metal-dependent hydrolase
MPRILTYNVHRCVGTDRRLDVQRVADVIAAYKPDIVALQELDVGRLRTGMVDQAHEIAHRLEMSFHFHPAMKVEEELYGDALLTRFPERLVQRAPLPGYGRLGGLLEPRGALWLAIDVDGVEVQVINTHLGLVPREQQAQADSLAGGAWLEHPLCKGPTILLGDFNATSGSVVHRILTRRLRDARDRITGRREPTTTFPSKMPVLRIDHIFVSDEVVVDRIVAPFGPLTRTASDHLPLIADFSVSS